MCISDVYISGVYQLCMSDVHIFCVAHKKYNLSDILSLNIFLATRSFTNNNFTTAIIVRLLMYSLFFIKLTCLYDGCQCRVKSYRFQYTS